MGMIETLQGYIDECDDCVANKDIQKAEKLVNTIVSVYAKDIKGIRTGLDRYSARVIGVGTVIKYDYLGDVELLKAKLIHFKEELENVNRDNGSTAPTININNVNENENSSSATNYTQITYEQIIETIHSIPDEYLSTDDKEALEDKIGVIELALKNNDKKKAIDKIGGVLKFITEKGVEVGIAILPYLGQIAQAFK